jgi:hypothetical protein
MTKFTLIAALASIVSVHANGQENRVSTPSFEGAKPQSYFTKSNSNPVVARGGISAINVAFSDDFSQANDTTSLKARGYLPYYRGAGPQGVTATWYQGTNATFPAYNGADTQYVAANYNVVTNANDIDSWLVTPALNTSAGDVISFYSRSISGSIYPDSIRVMYSAAGDSVPEGLTWVELGRFVVNIAGAWELKSYTVATGGATARFAIRYAVVDGGPLGNNSNFIGIDQLDVFTPQSINGGVLAINGLTSGCGLSASTPVSITIQNAGSSTLTSFPVGFKVDNGAPVSETFSGNIVAGGTANYTFTATANLSGIGAHIIKAFTAIPSDGNLANDTATTSVTNTAPTVITTVAYTQGFETATGTTPPAGWTTQDVDGDGNSWDFATTYPFNGLVCARVPFPTGNAAENWLFTPCLDLTSGTNYLLQYWYKSFDNSQTSFELETRFGNAANNTAMTNNIAIDPLFADSSYHLASHTFTVPTSGTYYVGFNGFSAAAQVSMRMDDASIQVVTGIKETTLENSVAITPNPTADFVNVTCKLAGKVELSVYNNLGQKIASYNYNEPFKIQLNFSTFAKGIYTLQFNSNDEVLVKKIVKQ